ncbi:MAG: nitroreductase [Acidimicrobiales bacterium]|jgi:nitroreductase
MAIENAPIDVEAVDLALSTTRAVRRRLDLGRDVDNQIILDCIDVAEQAPSGGNQGSRRWIIVRDPAMKARLADIYLEAAGKWMIESRDKIAGTGHPQEQVMNSAAFLAENLADVPAIVIPTIIGKHDGNGRPGLFDSVIQSAWSFSVALRARGLGSAWTTAILNKEDDIAELLGIPEGMTQIAMLPVGWTKGTDFKMAPRLPAREISYFDRYAHTWEHGPSDPPKHSDGAGTVVEVDIKAKPAAVWPFVSDISFGGQFSEEFVGASWDEGQEPGTGATFTGSNTHPAIGEWDVPCFVTAFEEDRVFAWSTSDPENPGARWKFELAGIAGATRLRYSMIIGPGPSGISAAIESMPDKEPKILSRRLDEHRANMQKVLDGIVAAVASAK